MGEIRIFEEAHIPEVAALELKVFHGRRQPAGPALEKYFEEIFFRNPWRDEELPSLVYLHNNKIAGFIGVIPRRMVFRDRPVRVAVGSQLMVDREECRGLAGLELVRRFFSGPQDLSLTDGATEAAHAVWTAAGARAAQLYALEWTRILRPLGLLRRMIEGRPKTGAAMRAAARLSSPGCALIDGALFRIPISPFSVRETACRSKPASAEMLLACMQGIGWRDELRPCYAPESLHWLLSQAADAHRHGVLRAAVVRDASGAPAGWYVYYAKRGGKSTTLQIGAAPRRFEDVFVTLLRDACAEGSTALSGQAIPGSLLALSNNHAIFQYRGNGVLAHSRDQQLLGCILQGQAALSRLDGEWWTRFAVGDWN